MVKQKGLWLTALALLCVGALALGIVGGLAQAQQARKTQAVVYALQKEDAAAIVASLDDAPWMKAVLEEEYRYNQGLVAWQNGRYEDSLAYLEGLTKPEGIAETRKAILYDQALSLLQERQFDACLTILKQLGDGYRDSAALQEDIKLYRSATDETKGKVWRRYLDLVELGDFLDSAKLAEKAQQVVADEAMELYLAAEYIEAINYFEVLRDGGMEHAELYVEACEIGVSTMYTMYMDSILAIMGLEDEEELEGLDLLFDIDELFRIVDLDESLLRLRELSADVDVAPIVMGHMMANFLMGEWVSSDGGGTFTMTAYEFVFSNYLLDGGAYSVYGGEIANFDTGRVAARVEYVDFDTVLITMVKDGVTHSFLRQ